MLLMLWLALFWSASWMTIVNWTHWLRLILILILINWWWLALLWCATRMTIIWRTCRLVWLILIMIFWLGLILGLVLGLRYLCLWLALLWSATFMALIGLTFCCYILYSNLWWYWSFDLHFNWLWCSCWYIYFYWFFWALALLYRTTWMALIWRANHMFCRCWILFSLCRLCWWLKPYRISCSNQKCHNNKPLHFYLWI